MALNYQSEWEEQASAPSNPATGNWKIYFKADGMYVLEDDGTEHGPFNAGGVPVNELPLFPRDGQPSSTNGSSAVTQLQFVTNDVDFMVTYFDDTIQEYFQWTVKAPGNWDGGTITYTAGWKGAGTPAEVVAWNLQGRAYGDGDVIDQAWGTAVEVTDALQNSTDYHETAESGAVTIAGAGAGKLLQLRLYRNTSIGSNMSGDAALINVTIYYGTV